MPSSPNYQRDYVQEYATETPERRKERAMRNKARRAFEKASGRPVSSNFDVDHIKPLSKGGGNSPGNLRVKSPSANRSYARNKDGSIKK